MNPNIWGPHAWIFLHSITLTYPNHPKKEDRDNYKNFFINLGDILPCSVCREHYKAKLTKTPLTNEILDSRDKLVSWLIDVHNAINRDTGKKMLTKNQVMEYYNNLYRGKDSSGSGNNNISNKKHISYMILISLVFVILITILIKLS
jgi:hypothetical protein